MKFLHFECSRCGDKSIRVNTDHALVKKGKWKVGTSIRTRCSLGCQKTTKHVIVEVDDGDVRSVGP